MGMLLQFVNPKGIFFGITVVASFILPYHTLTLAISFFSLFLGMVGIMSTYSWGLFGCAFQKFFVAI